MPAYLVRIIESRDLVGIFIADDEDDLAFVMDECRMRRGANTSSGRPGSSCGRPPPGRCRSILGIPRTRNPSRRAFRGVRPLTERWWYIAYGMEDVEWTPSRMVHRSRPPGYSVSETARQ